MLIDSFHKNLFKWLFICGIVYYWQSIALQKKKFGFRAVVYIEYEFSEGFLFTLDLLVLSRLGFTNWAEKQTVDSI